MSNDTDQKVAREIKDTTEKEFETNSSAFLDEVSEISRSRYRDLNFTMVVVGKSDKNMMLNIGGSMSQRAIPDLMRTVADKVEEVNRAEGGGNLKELISLLQRLDERSG
jgi:hypothetical protein